MLIYDLLSVDAVWVITCLSSFVPVAVNCVCVCVEAFGSLLVFVFVQSVILIDCCLNVISSHIIAQYLTVNCEVVTSIEM